MGSSQKTQMCLVSDEHWLSELQPQDQVICLGLWLEHGLTDPGGRVR